MKSFTANSVLNTEDPLVDISLNYPSQPKDQRIIKWRHCHHVAADSSKNFYKWNLVRDDVVPADVYQGELGNCWYIAALSALAAQPDLIRAAFLTNEVCPEGIYTIKLCFNGIWTTVTINDYIPCDIKGNALYGQIVRRQLWVPLLEKAFAKLNGCYAALTTGSVNEGFNAITGAPCETIFFQNCQLDTDRIWTQLISWHKTGFLMGTLCGGHLSTLTDAQCRQTGLLTKHLYSVLDIQELNAVRLIKLRDPLGDFIWTGDNTNELCKNTKDGIFWITFKKFLLYFVCVSICKLRRDWREVRFSGSFPPLPLHDQLPCLLITVTENTEMDCMLYQNNQRYLEPCKRSLLDMCLIIYKLRERKVKTTVPIGRTHTGTNVMENVNIFLNKGRYIAVPLASNHREATDNNGHTGYVIAVHTSKDVQVQKELIKRECLGNTLPELFDQN